MVVVVGTHIDKVKKFEKEKNLYVERIEELYSNQYYYPPIDDVKFISCDVKYKKYDTLFKDLRDTLYDMASAMKISLSNYNNYAIHVNVLLMILVSGNKRFEQKLLSVRIPVKYLELQNRIIAEATYYRRHREKDPPILSWNEIIKCA